MLVYCYVYCLRRSCHWLLQPASETVTIVAAAMSQSPLLPPDITVAAAPSQLPSQSPHHHSCHRSCHRSHRTIGVAPLNATPRRRTLNATPYCRTLAAAPRCHILAIASSPHHCQQSPYHRSLHPRCHYSIIKSSLLSLPYRHCCHRHYCHFIVVIVITVASLLSSLRRHCCPVIAVPSLLL